MGDTPAFSSEAGTVSDQWLRRPEDDNTQGIWQVKSAILTPGDRVEFKLTVKAGETLMASATSDAFDPALSVEDSKGVVLIKNDDRSDGDQSPFIVYRFAAEGAYTLKVLSYHSVSGGKFQLKMRRFLAFDVSPGKATHESVHLVDNEAQNRVVMRLGAKKGRIYDLRSVEDFGPRFRAELTLIGIVGPTGVAANDFTFVPTSTRTPVFEATNDGDIYLEYDTYVGKAFRTDVRELAPVEMKTADEKVLKMEPGELKVFDFAVVPNQIVRTVFKGSDISYLLSGPAGAASRISEGDALFGNNRNWTWFKANVDSDSDETRIFHGTGNVRIALRMVGSVTQNVTVTNIDTLPTWVADKEVKESLAIGDSRLFVIKSGTSELMRVFASASHFLPRLDIFQLNGQIVNSLENRTTHVATDDLYFPDEGTFVVRLTCDGNGGSGDFLMKRESLQPSAYKLGALQTMKLDGENFGLYSINLEAGKRYQLMTDEPNKFLRADLLDDDGHFFTSQVIVFDKVELQYFTPAQSGRHRLWLRGSEGVRHFKFELHVPPTLGSKSGDRSQSG